MYAAYALAQFGTDAKEALPALMKALHDEDASVRRIAAYAVAQIDRGVINEVPNVTFQEFFEALEKVPHWSEFSLPR